MMYNPFSLETKTILITGASSGIGQRTAIECSKLGANVIITGRNEERLNETFESLDVTCNQSHKIIAADISNNEGIEILVSNLEKLDGVFSNAGVVSSGPIKFIKEEEIERVLQTNLISHMLLAKTLHKKKLLKKGGAYVFTASVGGNTSQVPTQSVYGVSKSAINTFMKYYALELAPMKVRCNSVCPGMIETPMTQLDSLTGLTSDDIDRDKAKYLLGRYGRSEEVALTVAFLLSDAASFINGASIVIDGGYSINH